MGTNLHVQLTYDEKAKRFDCRNRLDEAIASLLNGDVFTLDHLNTTVLGIVKFSPECKPYGFYFESNDGQLKVQLTDGMKGYVEIQDQDKVMK